jgi:putative ATP-dependent endonuclease of the OLD family
MHISRVRVLGFKRFVHFDSQLDPHFNVIVGDNEAGKSSLLEAVFLVLTGQYGGRAVQYMIDPYLFNVQIVRSFFEAIRNGRESPAPEVSIEAYIEDPADDPEIQRLRGTNNDRTEDCPGLSLKIEVDPDYLEDLKEYALDESNPMVLPVEYYRVAWKHFGDDWMKARRLPFRTANIKAAAAARQRGPNRFLSQVVDDVLTEEQRRNLSLEYKKLRHKFAQEEGVNAINKHLESQGSQVSSKKLTVQMDMSSRASWDQAITAHLDDMPFDCAGMGEQCRIQLRLAIAGEDRAQVLLIEEPENHLSHSNLNALLKDVREDCEHRQVIVTTHSAFVLNKLGLDSLLLIGPGGEATRLSALKDDTRDYFMRLPGYDTLRLILARRSLLVEGPSDELIVQRAYEEEHARLPIEDGIDVISVRSLAFKRFLEIASLLNLNVGVVTDNDGDVAALKRKYASYLTEEASQIRIYFDEDETRPTLEPQLLGANSLKLLNRIFNTNCADDESLLGFMTKNKTDCALKLFETAEAWVPPGYIRDAIIG